MATKEDIEKFTEKEGTVGKHYPYHENIDPGTIRLWSPRPDETKDYNLKLVAEEIPAKSGNWFAKYENIGSSWDPQVVEFFKYIRLDYEPNGQYLYTKDIPDRFFPLNGWKIVEFGLAMFISGNLISRAEWLHPDGSNWVTAYSWPGC